MITKAWRERPELLPDLAPYWAAFALLSSRRQGEWQSQPIPLAEIAAYCNVLKIDTAEERERILEAVVLLDSEWLRLTRAEAAATRDGERQRKRPRR